MPSAQKDRPALSEMAILWTGNHLFQRDAWRHGGNLYGSSSQYRHYRCSIQYCFGTDRWKRRRYYADRYPTAGLGSDALYPIDYRTAYGRCLV